MLSPELASFHRAELHLVSLEDFHNGGHGFVLLTYFQNLAGLDFVHVVLRYTLIDAVFTKHTPARYRLFTNIACL